MAAHRFYQNQKAAAPEHLLESPFTSGDRVNTVHGTGTIYQSGPYESWVVVDENWTVTFVWTDMIKRLPDQIRIFDIQAGYPTVDQLILAGYEVRRVDTMVRTYGEALALQQKLSEAHPDLQYRLVKLPDYNEFQVVEATREEIPAYAPRGIG